MNELMEKGARAKKAAKFLAQMTSEAKNQALASIADQLLANSDFLLQENQKDLEAARKANTPESILDRLSLNEKRIQDMAEGVRQVMDLPDPLGEVIESFTRPNGLIIEKVRVPLGVIGIIYEARPNVTVDAAALCLKTGNAAFLRGSSSALHSNKAIVELIQQALAVNSLPREAVQLLEDTSYETSDRMLRLNQYLDVLIPRGGGGLISHVVQHATVPVLETGVGNCHIYIDESADPQMAVTITLNAKTQRPAVCNAVETILIHQNWADQYASQLFQALKNKGVELVACEKTRVSDPSLKAATEQDWKMEFLDLILAVKTVNSVEEAIAHIEEYGTGHSECIITQKQEHARKFMLEIDAAAVYHNASTRFTDGFEFGFGAEIGISTQKLHARGPMGLKELTSYKYLMYGEGQIRK